MHTPEAREQIIDMIIALDRHFKDGFLLEITPEEWEKLQHLIPKALMNYVTTMKTEIVGVNRTIEAIYYVLCIEKHFFMAILDTIFRNDDITRKADWLETPREEAIKMNCDLFAHQSAYTKHLSEDDKEAVAHICYMLHVRQIYCAAVL